MIDLIYFSRRLIIKNVLPVIIFIAGFKAVILAEEPYVLEKIVVRSSSPADRSTINYEDIQDMNSQSPADYFDTLSGVDLRYRGSTGIQGDLSLLGATYEQTALLIDGIKLMDPQTGHHNLDIPLTVYDIEDVSVDKKNGSSIYGSGAFSGNINLKVKIPKERSFDFKVLSGEHALNSQSMSLSSKFNEISSRVSFEHSSSKAARPNTDFDYQTLSAYLNYALDTGSIDGLFGYQEKDFGADSFYSNLFSEEEEHTKTLFFRGGLVNEFDSKILKNNFFIRKHDDEFILKRNIPYPANCHTTYIYGFDSRLDFEINETDMFIGSEIAEDEINSSSLGKHDRPHQAVLLGFGQDFLDRLKMNFSSRVDHYQNWRNQMSFGADLSYQISSPLNLEASFNRSFRVPSFTELYYSDAANRGNDSLGLEKADNYRLGVNYNNPVFDGGVYGFLRRSKDLIDWTRMSASDVWQATNLGKVDFSGIELACAAKLNMRFKTLEIKKVNFSYVYIYPDNNIGGYISKYALDVLKNQYTGLIYSKIFGLDFNWQLSYNQRCYGEVYFLGNLNISKKFSSRGCSLEPFIRIDNFTDAEYREVGSVLLPGRWIKGGIKFSW